MTPEPRRIDGVLISAADAKYLADAINEFSVLARMRGSRITVRLAKLQQDLAAATDVRTDADTRLSAHQQLSWSHSIHDKLDSNEAARILGCTPGNVRDLAKRGVLPAHRSGGRWLYSADAVELRAQLRT